MFKKIAITTSSFGRYDKQPLRLLQGKKFSLVFNKFGRTLTPKETLELLAGCVAAVAGTERYDQKILGRLPRLKVISRCGVGTDNIDLKVCQKRRIKVFTTPDAPTRAVAELVMGFVLSLLRNIHLMDRSVRSQQWQKKMGGLFQEKKVGVIGFGRIGKEVARLSRALGAEIFYFDPYVKQAPRLLAHARKLNLKDLLRKCDIISLHLPLNPQNKHLISVQEFNLMKENAILINCSRGGIVDEPALYQALKKKKLAGAGLDVFEHEPYRGSLLKCDNVILTPHVGSYAKESRVRMELEAVSNLIKGLKIDKDLKEE